MQFFKKISLGDVILISAIFLLVIYDLYTGRALVPYSKIRHVYLSSNPLGYYLSVFLSPVILVCYYVWRTIDDKNSTREKKEFYKEHNTLKKDVINKTIKISQSTAHLIKINQKTNSKIGGNPEVNKDNFNWPRIDNKPMAFLAQIDLKEISQEVDYHWLNNSGSILFFYDLDTMPWGFDPKDRGRWSVIYQEKTTMMIDFPKDFEQKNILKESYISPYIIKTLPPSNHRDIKNLNLSEHEESFYSVYDTHYPELSPYKKMPRHQVGGFPSALQRNMMEFEAQSASTGTYMGGGKIFKSSEAQEFMSKPNNWKLLFQLDLNDDLGIQLEASGRLYFWVETNLSKKNNFENTWLIFQSN